MRDTERNSEGDRRQRGATAIEYALLVALFVLVVFGGIQFFQDRAGQKFDDEATSLSANSGGGPGVTVASTTTTAPPATTTTVAATTTTAAPALAVVDWPDEGRGNDGSGKWKAWAQVRIKRGGSNVSGAQVTIQVKLANGTVQTTYTCTTANNGRCPADQWVDGIPNSSNKVTFTVTAITATPPLSVPSGPSNDVNKP